MSQDAFALLDETARQRGAEAVFDFLIARFRDEKNYPSLFEARLMKQRHALGLPLIARDTDAWPAETRRLYEKTCVEAARETGGLFLADGDIARAWPYFRAIGETAPVAAAIEKVEAGEGIEPVIEIAFQEGLNPKKGFELILAHHGICRALTLFPQYPAREGRQACLQLLVRSLHADLAANLSRAIASGEGSAPETWHLPSLIGGRDWLFGEHAYYVDTSHVVSVLQISLDLTDREHLDLALQIAEYGRRLAPMFHFRGEPPFENIYEDHAVYLGALLGVEVEAAIAHFRRKVAAGDPAEMGTAPAQALVGLLLRLERYADAAAVSIECLRDADPRYLTCPTPAQLCVMAGDFDRLRALALERGDLIEYAAAALGASRP